MRVDEKIHCLVGRLTIDSIAKEDLVEKLQQALAEKDAAISALTAQLKPPAPPVEAPQPTKTRKRREADDARASGG